MLINSCETADDMRRARLSQGRRIGSAQLERRLNRQDAKEFTANDRHSAQFNFRILDGIEKRTE
jgi:hypothetical protein